MINYFYVSGTAAVAGVVAAYYYAGWPGAALTIILAALEISLSIENAIVNAAVLKDMDELWRRRFLTWGIIIAVFGMRLLFPVAMVAAVTHLSLFEVVDLALEQPMQYEHYLTLAHGTISAFGGMFLLMVFLEFLFDHKREIHWLGIVERKLAQVGNIEAIEVAFALLVLLIVQNYVPHNVRSQIMIAGIWGLLLYVVVHGLAKYMNTYVAGQTSSMIKRGGLFSFIYLEILDASFSFDGVIGAFAITKDIVLIALGLGIGAFFVRSLTVLLVNKRTLQKYIFLEHGAYYALGTLAMIMLLGIFYKIPEVLIGSIGAIIIAIAFVASLRRLS